MVKKLLLTLIVASSLFTTAMAMLPNAAYASGPDECFNSSGFLGFPTWYKYLEIGPKENLDKNGATISVDPCGIIGPTATRPDGKKEFSFEKAVPRVALALAEILLRVAGMVAVGYVIFGGFKYMTSQGQPEGVKAAQGTVINALIGLAIAVLAVTVVGFIARTLWS